MTLRIPADFESHQHTWLLWPVRPDNWRGDALFAQDSMLKLITAIAKFEPVRLGILPSHIQSVSSRMPLGVTTYPLEYDDIWVRDTGPICVQQYNEIIALDWHFNSWGGLFESWALDDTVPDQICTIESIPINLQTEILEGGAINVDGEGTLLTTSECLLKPNRNINYSKFDYEKLFKNCLGISKVIWLPLGIAGDETGGHVDNICVFVKPAHVILAWTDVSTDGNYDRCRIAFEVLANSVDAKGRPLTITKIPLPDSMHITKSEADTFSKSAGTISRMPGDRLAASYVNFYPVNGGVIVPTFDDAADNVAIAILQTVFPNRKIVGVSSREFLLGGGGPHCLTQQIPRAIGQ